MAKILVTGGAGYICSHTCIQLLSAGHEVVVLDNLSNSSVESLARVQALAAKKLDFVEGDILDQQILDQIFQHHSIDAVIHFAGLKAVGESQKEPLKYFENNISGSISLVKAMERAQVFKLVFSSSATVYDEANISPLNENMPTGMPSNNYGYTKLIVEQMLQKLAIADARWSIALLRYFNPVGAHSSGLIGELPTGIPNNLMPYICQVATGKLKCLSIFRNDYDTTDGTGVRDYIHIVDLAKGHLAAVNYLSANTGCHTWNLGTGVGYSVLEILSAFEKASGIKIPYTILKRRPGDIAKCWSNPQKALDELGWKAELSLQDMVSDAWRWQSNIPKDFIEVS